MRQVAVFSFMYCGEILNSFLNLAREKVERCLLYVIQGKECERMIKKELLKKFFFYSLTIPLSA